MNQRGDILQWTIELAHTAGREATKLLEAGAQIEMKADTTTVTNIDRAIETLLRQKITAQFPNHAIYGEEQGLDADRDPNAPLWAIDPIDGTANLAHGLPQWAISIGLIEQNIPTVGVVYAPLLDELYAGAAGLGASRNGVALKPLPVGGILGKEDLYAACSTSVRRLDWGNLRGRFRIPGSAALNLCWTADGRYAASQSMGTSLYDVAAGIVIAREVGCQTRWLDGTLWDAAEMLRAGARPRVLITAMPATLDYVRGCITER